MHPREVPDVGEVLELTRGVGVPRIRAGGHESPGGVLELRDVGQVPARLVHRDPQEAEALLAPERVDARLARHASRVLELRDRLAYAVGAVLPAVIRAHQPIPDHTPERKSGAAVDAEVPQDVRPALGIAPDDEVLTE